MACSVLESLHLAMRFVWRCVHGVTTMGQDGVSSSLLCVSLFSYSLTAFLPPPPKRRRWGPSQAQLGGHDVFGVDPTLEFGLGQV